jgi:hypothetical protein
MFRQCINNEHFCAIDIFFGYWYIKSARTWIAPLNSGFCTLMGNFHLHKARTSLSFLPQVNIFFTLILYTWISNKYEQGD